MILARRSIGAALGLAYLLGGAALFGEEEKYVLPDVDKTRKERIAVLSGRKLLVPDGFVIEEVAKNDLVGSIVNMTFDDKGRPSLAKEGAGILLLIDKDGDGKADGTEVFADQIKTAHGMYYAGPGDLIVNAQGPNGDGLYRLTDTDGDDKADKMTALVMSRGGIGEHGPHTIMGCADGSIYVLYGNHSFPDAQIDPASPSRRLQEDNLIPYYVDPRGHANNIRAPGGTIHRIDLATNKMTQIVGGFRNAFDMAATIDGEIYTYDSDMEWDVGLPWYRPTRAIHCIPGGDYGWRTGSGKFSFTHIDTLPGVDDIGRGSPVGVAFYYHDAYPKVFQGALFLGDWSRGRVRVIFPRREGATWVGKSRDFVLGEPLNVTDLDVGPDGNLYFSVGGRGTSGGVYRVRYVNGGQPVMAATALDRVLSQPMPFSAWGSLAIQKAKAEMGANWEKELASAAMNRKLGAGKRVRALVALQVHGPRPDLKALAKLSRDKEAEVRAEAIYLLGTHPLNETRGVLTEALTDSDPLVARRACEALVRSGLCEDVIFEGDDPMPRRLFALLDHEDRFLRYGARLALMRVDRRVWANAALADDPVRRPRGTFESLLALIYTQGLVSESDLIFEKLGRLSRLKMDDEAMLDYLRVLQLAFMRDLAPREPGRQGFMNEVGPRLLAVFPAENLMVNRDLQTLLAHMQTPGAIEALLTYLTPDKTQEEQIHTIYCLRAIHKGWTRQQRDRAVAWFDRGREFGGAASMEGYINNLWDSILAHLPEGEKKAAEDRKEKALAERSLRAARLMAQIEGDKPSGRSDLAQMSFQELSEYLEYDVMTYERGNAEKGEIVFKRSKCADCHVFGTIGKGGGPDLSTVIKRFRRSEILESIMYPSKVISDQYQAFNVELKNGDTINGMLVSEGDAAMTLITPTGERLELKKPEIKESRPSTVSIMPEGLLDTMSLGDLVNLMLFLERGSDM